MAQNDSMAWQRQNFKKVGSASAPSQMNSKLSVSVGGGLHSKIAKPTHPMGVVSSGFGPSVAKFADGGSVDDATYQSAEYQADKKAGLEASKDEKVGLWERIKAGNIDDPTSEAYRRFGAGRGMAERMKSMPDESEAETKRLKATVPEKAPEPAPATTSKVDTTDTEFGDLEGAMKRAAEAPNKVSEDKPAASKPVSKPVSKPAAKPDTNQSAAETTRLKERNAAAAPAPTPSSAKTFAEDVAQRKAAANKVTFDPSSINNFGPAPEKKPEPVRRHPRTGRPY